MPGIVKLKGGTREPSVAQEQMVLLGRRSAKAAFLIKWRDRLRRSVRPLQAPQLLIAACGCGRLPL